MNNSMALIALMKKYDKRINLTNGEITYCLNEIDKYEKVVSKDMLNDIPEMNRFWNKLSIFRGNLLAEKRLRVIDKIL